MRFTNYIKPGYKRIGALLVPWFFGIAVFGQGSGQLLTIIQLFYFITVYTITYYLLFIILLLIIHHCLHYYSSLSVSISLPFFT